jgi:ribosomal protein S1
MLEVTVKRLVEFGAFVDLGGIDGLIRAAKSPGIATRNPKIT